MKIQKLAKAIKKSKHLQVVNAVNEEGEAFQMVGYLGNLYKIHNMPQLNDIQMLTFLGMDKEDKGKLNYQVIDTKSSMYYDYCPGEEPVFWRTLLCDPEVKAFWKSNGDDGEIVFTMVDSFDLSDITGGTQAFLRGNKNDRYIAIKEGMFLKALLPVLEVSTDGRIEELEFELKLLKGENRSGN